MAENRLLHLSDAEAARIQKGAVDSAIVRFKDTDTAKRTAGIQSGLGLHLALLFGAGAAVAATVASSGVLAPSLFMLGAKSSAIFAGMWATILGVGQGRKITNENQYRNILKKRGFT
jgi:hypothetical protein